MNIRRVMLSLFASLFLAPMMVSAQATSSGQPKVDRTNGIEQEVLRLEEAGRQKALKGETSWDDLIANGAYMIAYDGSVIQYESGKALPALPLKSFQLAEMIARVYDSVVVVTGLAELEGETPQKQLVKIQQRFLNVWKKVDGRWKIVVSERTPVRSQAK